MFTLDRYALPYRSPSAAQDRAKRHSPETPQASLEAKIRGRAPGWSDGLSRTPFEGGELPEKKWMLRDGRPHCRECGGRLKPVDEPAGLKCSSCGQMYVLTEEELADLTLDLSD